jgi:biopolymer transport protein ExbD
MADAINLNDLMSSLSFWERGGYIGLAAVIFGVIGETIHEFAAWPHWEWWRPRGGKLSALVLIAGLAIEGVAQINANNTSDRVIAVLRDEEAATKERAEELRKANLALEKQLNPRTINDEQADVLIKAIRPFAGVPFEVEADPTAEYGFVDRLITLLTEAGWQWKGYASFAMSLPPGNELVAKIQRDTGGVQVRIRANNTAEFGAAAKALSFALTNAIGSVSLGYDPDRPGRSLFVAPADAILIQIFRVR